MKQLNRRDFLQAAAATVPFCLLDPMTLARAAMSKSSQNLNFESSRLSEKAFATTRTEGEWALLNIEGSVPPSLRGALYRIGSGQKENYGVSLRHFFDGDPLISKFSFDGGAVKLVSKFLNTPERTEELAARQMLYHEFGTQAPGDARGFKFQPNINILSFNEKLFALSESGHPSEFDAQKLTDIGLTDFAGALPENVTFTAHPKTDPRTGDVYTYGITQGLSLALNVFRLSAKTGALEPIYSASQNSANVIHDMLMTENYLIFVVPPLTMKIWDRVVGKAPLADSLEYSSGDPLRILILRKDGQGEPVELTMPSAMVFHNGNAYEDGPTIVIDSFLAQDGSLMKAVADWRGSLPAALALPALTRIEIDLLAQKIKSKAILHESCDFPAYDAKLIGQKQNSIYFTEFTTMGDPFAGTAVAKYEFESKSILRFQAEDGEAFGEAIVVATSEHETFCLFMGYSSKANKSFLQILNGESMKTEARVWAESFIPLGFHGAYVAAK